MLKIAIIFIIFSQTFESTQEYFERFKQTVNEETFCTVGKKLNPTITILFWNKLVDGMIDGLGFEPFQTCLHKSFISTREKSLLNNSKHTIDAISDGSGPKPGPGPARSPGFLESPRPDFGRRAQARARPEPVVKSPGAQRALGI